MMRNAIPCTVALCVGLFLNSGCGYVHFGRVRPADPTVLSENADLRTEKKILQQELAIARKEGEGLRLALQAKTAGQESAELAAKLDATTRELAALRMNYSELEDRLRRVPGGAENQLLRDKLANSEEKLAKSLRESTELRREADALRGQIQEQRKSNSELERQMTGLRSENERVRGALAQLNQELVAQKQARADAQQAAEAMRAQLRAVMDQERAAPGAQPKLSELRENTASAAGAMEATGLSLKEARSDGPVTAQIKTSQSKLMDARMRGDAAQAAATAPNAGKSQLHRVGAGDSLESIARKYYGDTEQWRVIYAANLPLLQGGKPLSEGMELVIPEASH